MEKTHFVEKNLSREEASLALFYQIRKHLGVFLLQRWANVEPAVIMLVVEVQRSESIIQITPRQHHSCCLKRFFLEEPVEKPDTQILLLDVTILSDSRAAFDALRSTAIRTKLEGNSAEGDETIRS